MPRRVGLAPRRCSTPSWPGGWPGFRGSGWARWSSSCSGCAREGARGGRLVAPPAAGDWLVYAALDVEVLVEVRDVLAELLAGRASSTGRSRSSRPYAPRRRRAPAPSPGGAPPASTACASRARAPVRALWEARDRLAGERDIAPGRVLPDAAIVEPPSRARAEALARCPSSAGAPNAGSPATGSPLSGRPARPGRPSSPADDGPPPVARWSDRDPDAAAGWPRPARGRPRWARAGPSRWRTSCSPTCCDVCAGPPPDAPPGHAAGRRRPGLADRAPHPGARTGAPPRARAPSAAFCGRSCAAGRRVWAGSAELPGHAESSRLARCSTTFRPGSATSATGSRRTPRRSGGTPCPPGPPGCRPRTGPRGFRSSST